MNRTKTNHGPAGKLAVLGLLAFVVATRATPYATDVTNNSGQVSFRLNENADNIKIISSAGAVTNDLGPGLKGLTVTNLGVAAGTIKVMVTRSVPVGYTQISNDGFQDNGVYVNKYEQARGVVVNRNPATPSFGRIYIANGRGQADTSTTYVRTCYQGIYMLNSDDTVALDTGTFPRTAGFAFAAGNTATPNRLTIGKDDNLLYICDWSDPSGGLWVTDLDVTSGTNVLQGIGDLGSGSTTHGSVAGVWVEGTAGNNLKIFTTDEDLAPGNSLWRYDIGNAALPSTNNPTLVGSPNISSSQIMDVVRGGSSNYLYLSQRRSAGSEPNLFVFKEDGTFVTNSLLATREFVTNNAATDILREVLALDISPDGGTLALLRANITPTVLLVPLTNGVFNLGVTNGFNIGSISSNNRDIAYDAAGNIYVVNTSVEWLRIFSKGGASVAITGTDGTFVLGTPPTIVNATAAVPTANEQGLVNGTFTLTRVGDTTVPLTVNYTVGGSATPGSDYTALPGSVTFLAGAASTNITVAVKDDAVAELTETVELTLSGSGAYGVGTGSATVSILDNEPTEVAIGLAQGESRLLEGYSASTVGFTLTRRGLIGPALTVNLGYSGAATLGADYNGVSSLAIGAGQATATFNLTPIDDELYEGNEIINVSVVAGSGYVPGSPSVAQATIVDDDYPPGTVLFADKLDADTATNWIINSLDGGVDSAAEFGFDYSGLYVPTVPGNATTKALHFRLNQLTGAPRNAISISPLALSLDGDYRLKFKVWNNYNGPMLDGGAGSTMHFSAGVGTTPDHANIATSAASDGIWFDLDGDGGSTLAIGDCNAYVGVILQTDDSGTYAAGTNSPRSTTTPYYAIWGGLPAPTAQLANFPSQTGTSQPGNLGMAWHTVVITKATNAVALAIDGLPISTVPADSLVPGGNVFVGFEDIFPGASGTPEMSFALVANLRVETYVSAPLHITGLKLVGANVEISFTGPTEAVAANFKLQSSASVAGTYVDDNSATLSDVGPGSFKATTAASGSARFFKIRH